MTVLLKDLTAEEKDAIQGELASGNSMVLMIFRFFLQSNEYQFFIRRLKNVALTRMGAGKPARESIEMPRNPSAFQTP